MMKKVTAPSSVRSEVNSLLGHFPHSQTMRARIDRLISSSEVSPRSVVAPAVVLAVFIASSLLAHAWRPQFLENLKPPDMLSSYNTLWQVQAAMVGLGIPLLILLVEQARSPTVTSTSVGQVLVSRTHVIFVTVLSIGSVVKIGLSAVYLASDQVLVVDFALSALCIGMILWGFYRALALLMSTERLRSASQTVLHDLLATSMQAAVALRLMDQRLSEELHGLDLGDIRQDELDSGEWSISVSAHEGSIVDVDVHRLKQLLGSLGALAAQPTRQASRRTESATPAAQVFRVRFRGFGEHVRAGDVLIAVSGEIGDAASAKLGACVTVASKVRAPTDDFRRELKSLRDKTISAINRHAIGDLEDGLDLYSQLIKSVLRTFNDLHARTSSSAPALLNPFGQEMTWLENDVETFIDLVPLGGRARLLEPLLAFFDELLVDLWDAGEIDEHGRVTHTLLRLYWRCIHDSDGSQDAARSVLTHLRSHAQYRLAFSSTKAPPGVLANAINQVVDSMFEAFRLAVLVPSIDAAVRCVTEIGELREALAFLAGDGRRTASPTDGVENSLRRIDGFALGSFAFIILAANRGRIPPDAADQLLGRLDGLLPSDRLWTAFIDSNEDLGRPYPWLFWEISLTPEEQRSGAFGHLDSAIDEAFARRVVKLGRIGEPGLSWASIDPAVRSAVIGRVIRRLDFVDSWLPRLPPHAHDVVPRVRGLLQAMQANSDDEDVRRRDQLPLDEAKVESFLADAASMWGTRTTLRAAVRTETPITDPPSEVFGRSILVPKDFFSRSHDHSEPGDVARDLASSIHRGETVRILEALGGLVARDVPLADLRSHVVDEVARLRALDFHPMIVAVGTWHIYQALTASPWANPDQPAPQVDGANVELEYADDANLCIVADISAAVTLRRWRLSATRPHDRLIADDLLVAAVQNVDASYALELVKSDLNFRRDPNSGELVTVDVAVQRLRNRVNVRLFEKVSIELVNREAGVIFRITDATDE